MEHTIEQRRLRPATRLLIAGGLAVGLNTLVACGPSDSNERVATQGATATSPDRVNDTRAQTTTTEAAPGTTIGTTVATKAPETTTTTEAKKRQEHIVSNDGVGNIYIGESRLAVDAIYSISDTPSCGGKEFYIEDAYTELSVNFDAADKVSQITVHDLGVKTEKGIEIGSTRTDVLTAYNSGSGPTTSVLNGVNGNVDFLVVENQGANLNFMITPKDGDKRVTAIIITPPGQDAVLACD